MVEGRQNLEREREGEGREILVIWKKKGYGIEAHNYIVDEVGRWLMESYLNIVQWSVGTEHNRPWCQSCAFCS